MEIGKWNLSSSVLLQPATVFLGRRDGGRPGGEGVAPGKRKVQHQKWKFFTYGSSH